MVAFLLTLPNRNYKSQVVYIKENTNDEYGVDNSKLILSLLTENKTLSRREIQDKLNMKQTSCILLLNKLEDVNKIKKVGQGKNVRYKLQ